MSTVSMARWLGVGAVCAAMSVAAWSAEPPFASAGPGLRPDGLPFHWARLQARLGLGVTGSGLTGILHPQSPPGFDASAEGLQIKSLNVLGDFYFKPSSGFRATGGVLLGSREQPWSAPPKLSPGGVGGLSFERRGASTVDNAEGASTVPYVGIGYSDVSLRGRWGFAADVGIMALNPGSGVRLGRMFNGAQAVEEYLRDLRLAPTVQLGVTYSF